MDRQVPLKLLMVAGRLSRERQKPKMEVVMHKSPEFDDAVAQESAAGRQASQRSKPPRYLAPCHGCANQPFLHSACRSISWPVQHT